MNLKTLKSFTGIADVLGADCEVELVVAPGQNAQLVIALPISAAPAEFAGAVLAALVPQTAPVKAKAEKPKGAKKPKAEEIVAKASPDEPEGSPGPGQVEAAVETFKAREAPPRPARGLSEHAPESEPAATGGPLDADLLKARRMTDLVDHLFKAGFKTLDAMVAQCEAAVASASHEERRQPGIKMIKRAPDLGARLKRGAETLGLNDDMDL